MNRANDSGSGSQEYFDALFEEEKSDGDIFFELDNILQCVSGFDLEERAELFGGFQEAAPHAVIAAVGKCADVKPGRDDESLLQDDELRWTETVTMLDTPSCNTSDLSLFEAPAMYNLSPANHSSSPPISDSMGTAQSTPVPRVTCMKAPATSEAPKTKNQNRSRKRQREEVERLRTSEKEMQIQVQTLLSGCDEPNNLSQKQMLTYLEQNLAWKRAASIDKEQADRGAVENLKLRALIQEYALICKSLSETCSKFCGPSAQDVGPGFTYVDMEKPAVLPDSAIFDSLRQSLDAQYQQLSTVWDECNFTNARTELKQPSNKLRSDDDGQLYFEYTKSHIFPFATTAVSQTIWRLTKGGLLTPNDGELKVCRVMGNTLYVTLNDTIVLTNTPDSKIRAWIAMKRFIEDDRIVMVWRAKMKIQHTSTVQLTECGWNVTRGLAGTKKSTDILKTAPCISQTCICSYSDSDCPVSRAEMATGSLTEKVVQQYHQNMSKLNQMIENMLLDESIASRDAT